MKISELIAELEKAMSDVGDIEVRVGSYKLSEPAERIGYGEAPDEHGGFMYLELGSFDNGPIW